MNKQDNRLAISVIATLASGIALIYTLITYSHILFAVMGVSLIFLICAFVLTQNIIAFLNMQNKSINVHIKDCVDDISTQLEQMNGAQSQIGKANYLYARKIAQTVSTLESNYRESQEALYKNLTALSSAQNKATKLMIKYDQSNTTKVISTLKDLRNQLSDTMIQGFDQIQPNNSEMVSALEDIVSYLKSQPGSMDQAMGLQLNNVAHELQNISNSIQRVQIPIQGMMAQAPMSAIQQEIPPVQMQMPEQTIPEPMIPTDSIPEAVTPVNNIPEAIALDAALADALPPEAMDGILPTEPVDSVLTEEISEEHPEEASPDVTEETAEAAITETEDISPEISTEETEAQIREAQKIEEQLEEITETVTPEPAPMVSDDPNKQLTADEIAALFAAAEPAPKKEEPAVDEKEEEEEAFTPTFTVVGKSEPKEEPIPEPVTPVLSDDPNKQLSADEIAALFAAAEPAPKKEEPAPEPVAPALSDDPNKQLSPDEIAALFAAAEPAPKKEEPKPEPVAPVLSDDPNKQLSPDEIAALFASMG